MTASMVPKIVAMRAARHRSFSNWRRLTIEIYKGATP
jgi:hypothetical protein